MEQFLNFFWLAITQVTTLTWVIVRVRKKPGSRCRPFQEAAGLGCAFLLLFFPISMTDDLHFEMVLIEGGDQRHSTVLACPDDQPSPGGTTGWATHVAILPGREALESRGRSHDLFSAVEPCPSIFVQPPPPDRSPPSSSL
jgi:hypothetical protein